jgi:phosphohistidine phosphatase
MRLLLIRHAIAEERSAKHWPDDADRPLTQRGIRRFRSAAEGLGTLFESVDALLTSPFVRAHQTATILEDRLGWPEPEVHPHLACGAPLAGAVALLANAERRQTVVVVGHEPTLSLLTSAYVASPSAQVTLDWRRGGAALLEFDESPRVNAGSLLWFLAPRVLRTLGGD